MVETQKPLSSYFRYLPVSAEARKWGLWVTDAGFTHVPGGADYPSVQHPSAITCNYVCGAPPTC